MHFAVIPLVVWAILAAFGAGGAIGLGGGYVLWKNRPDNVPLPVTNKNGIAMEFGDAMDCVDYYYKAIMKCNHDQYQFCVLDPIPIEEFRERVSKRLEEVRKQGVKQYERPVKGRSAKFKEVKGIKGVHVKAISPWTNKEETYLVVEQAQSWRIVKEK